MKVNRIVAILIMIILTVVPVFAVSAGGFPEPASANEGIAVAAEYTPRLTAPSKSNRYYYSNDNLYYASGWGMPNCTAYAYGRAYELLGTKPKLSPNSAHYWWGYNKENNYYPYGQTPKVGAIACWNNPWGGHVAVVEKITDTTITLSNSEWAGRTFYLTNFAVGASNGGVNDSSWTFYGYIYILEGENLPEGDIYRIDSDNGVNLRKGAGTSYKTLTSIPYNQEITVTETKKADGYTWGKTTYDGYTGWCVLDFATLIYQRPTEPEVTPPTEPEVTPPTEPEVTPPSETPLPPATEDEAIPPATSDEVLPPEIPDKGPVIGNGPELCGDVNGDGKVNILDVTLMQKYLASLIDTIDERIADVNGDGKLNVGDVTYLQKVLVSL
ncbi:MAG: SH3 domain-containing protein [Ruminococcus sp.]|nr:SH3 domain-containing protein [Ruminococcus sp.]